jgi:hypothetical protein
VQPLLVLASLRKRNSSSADKSTAGTTMAGMAPVGTGAVMLCAKASDGAALSAGTIGIVIILRACMVRDRATIRAGRSFILPHTRQSPGIHIPLLVSNADTSPWSIRLRRSPALRYRAKRCGIARQRGTQGCSRNRLTGTPDQTRKDRLAAVFPFAPIMLHCMSPLVMLWTAPPPGT